MIPEGKWEGLRHAMEEAAGTRKTSGTPGLLPEGEAARETAKPASGKKRGAEGEREKGGKSGKQEKKRKKKKEGKKDRKGKKEKGEKKKSGKKKKKGKG